jgi:hypothetical protein
MTDFSCLEKQLEQVSRMGGSLELVAGNGQPVETA